MTNGLTGYRPATRNANRHTQRGLAALERSIREDGYVAPITVAADGEAIDGSARLETVADILPGEPLVVHHDGKRPVIMVRDDIENAHTPRAQRLALASNRVGQIDLEWDVELLAQMPAETLEGLWTAEELSDLGQQWAAKVDGDGTDTPPALTRHDVPDALWPSDNDWGIPTLDMHWQADALDLPVQPWGMGAGARTRTNKGTWHFYTEDYRFSALWDDPSPVLNSGCVNVVEPNFSCYTDMPPAVALYRIYQKRWLARYWQSRGVRVFADLNVAEPHYALNMLGIPKGWRAWATRGYTERMDSTEREYAMACERAGSDDILFMVYGGGKQVRELCQTRGWLHVIEQRDAAKEIVNG